MWIQGPSTLAGSWVEVDVFDVVPPSDLPGAVMGSHHYNMIIVGGLYCLWTLMFSGYLSIPPSC